MKHLAQSLAARAAQFEQALRQGGSRQQYRQWQSSLEALQLASTLLARLPPACPSPTLTEEIHHGFNDN